MSETTENEDGMLKDTYPEKKKRGWKENLLEYLFTSPEGILGKRKKRIDEELGEPRVEQVDIGREKKK